MLKHKTYLKKYSHNKIACCTYLYNIIVFSGSYGSKKHRILPVCKHFRIVIIYEKRIISLGNHKLINDLT